MGRTRVFFIKRRISTLFRRRCFSKGYRRLEPQEDSNGNAFSNLITHLRTRVKAVLTRKHLPGVKHSRFGLPAPAPAPKGHIAVYVGQADGDYEKVFVPVVCFNHPLFGDLLKESEKEFGFNYPGGITIPCKISEFESVRTRIGAVKSCDKVWTWKRICTKLKATRL